MGKYVYKKGYKYAQIREEFLVILGVDIDKFDMRHYVD